MRWRAPAQVAQMGPCPHARPCVGWRVCVRQNVPLEKILPHPMQTLRRNRCQTRTRPREKACVYGVRVSGATIFAYADANPVIKGDPNGRHPVVVILIIYGKLVLRCELIHQSYKHLESNVCRRCGGDCDPTEAAANCACWAPVVQLRKNYLKGKCDYILPGSIAKGSKKAEQSHNFELTKTIQARNKCCGKALLDSID